MHLPSSGEKVLRTIITLLTPLLYATALITVVLTAHFSGYEHFLKWMTQENGIFESVSVVLLLVISSYGAVALYTYRGFTTVEKTAIILFSFVAFLAAMEEISWGQHLLHFQSGSYFMQHNIQHETNLHNLVDGNLFSSIIYSTVYTFLVFIPLLYKLFFHRIEKLHWLHWFDISEHTILITLFASSFQIYFYNDIGVIFDMVTLLSGLGLFGYYLLQYPSTPLLKVHFLFVLFSTALFMAEYQIFDFFNMQYEIREMFVVLASALIFMELIEKQRA
jgi:hypothetical protein